MGQRLLCERYALSHRSSGRYIATLFYRSFQFRTQRTSADIEIMRFGRYCCVWRVVYIELSTIQARACRQKKNSEALDCHCTGCNGQNLAVEHLCWSAGKEEMTKKNHTVVCK